MLTKRNDYMYIHQSMKTPPVCIMPNAQYTRENEDRTSTATGCSYSYTAVPYTPIESGTTRRSMAFFEKRYPRNSRADS